jgi:S-adenosylmethionine hydrolase
MTAALVTLTTDFGRDSAYVAAMKGSLLSVNPQARLLDLSHDIAPQDLRQASYFLRSCVPHFPAGTLHVVVVDPGVGTDRVILYAETQGQRLLVPDNGCWTSLVQPAAPLTVVRVTEQRYWRQRVSATFHGRDIFAPVAGHLSLGLDPRQLGPRAHDWVKLAAPVPVQADDSIVGEVVFIDRFGNLITNIPEAWCQLGPDRGLLVTVDGQHVPGHVRAYGEAAAGTLVTLISSVDTLEVAVTNGSAAERLGAKLGSVVRAQPVVTAAQPAPS